MPGMFIAAAFACVPSPTLLVEPDAARDGLGGDDGPHGAAQVERAYGSGLAAVDSLVVYPADAHAEPSLDDAPAVVLVHGGFVRAERYTWLARHLATRGYAVVLPRHAFDLAIVATGNARIARDGLLDDDLGATEPVAVGGHSLGGVVAAMNWASDEDFVANFLLAAYPAESTEVESRTGGSVLSLAGGDDGRSAYADVCAGFERYAVPGWLGVIDGMNHYDWTDEATGGELAGDGAASLPQSTTRPRALAVLDAWLDLELRGDAEAAARLEAEAEGVSLVAGEAS